MKYSEKTLSNKADLLIFRAACTVVFYTALFPLLAFTILGIAKAIIQGEHPLTIARPADPHAVGMELFIWAGIGFCVGIGKWSSYTTKAHEVLCAIEQEKHLRFIASELARDSRWNRTPTATEVGSTA